MDVHISFKYRWEFCALTLALDEQYIFIQESYYFFWKRLRYSLGVM